MSVLTASSANSAARLQLSTAFVVAILSIVICMSSAAQAQTFTVLHKFTGGSDGANPNGLILTPSGDLIGGAGYDNCPCGLIFKLSPSGSETVLHRFVEPTGAQAEIPSGFVLNSATNMLYGETTYGGKSANCDPSVGCGMVFSLNLSTLRESPVHYFTNSPDGSEPVGSLLLNSAGDLFGVTLGGGTNSTGTVFEISPTNAEKVVYSFGNAPDGNNPGSNVMSGGKVYGVTISGGDGACNNGDPGCGTVFEVTLTGTETILHNFTGGSDGRYPYLLVKGPAGSMYGLSRNVDNTVATVFKVSATGQFSILYNGSFASKITTIIAGPSGSLYGTANGGVNNSSCNIGCGQIFQLKPNGSGGGIVTILHKFNGSDGWQPNDLVLKTGVLYGSTAFGGPAQAGVVYKLAP
jgi:uncharacterized repeat protein (TIGR03803 family)